MASFITVRIIEPDLCDECRFNKVRSALRADGTEVLMMFCTRGDCNNWEYDEESSEPVQLSE